MNEERRRQIRFELGELRAQNSQHEFEKLCLSYTLRRICSNVRPSTGPVAAGGDQGRDFETFSTYVLRDPASDVAYRPGVAGVRGGGIGGGTGSRFS